MVMRCSSSEKQANRAGAILLFCTEWYQVAGEQSALFGAGDFVSAELPGFFSALSSVFVAGTDAASVLAEPELLQEALL